MSISTLYRKTIKNTVVLSTEVLEDYPDDIPEFKRESGLGGWNYFIKDRLYNYLLRSFN